MPKCVKGSRFLVLVWVPILRCLNNELIGVADFGDQKLDSKLDLVWASSVPVSGPKNGPEKGTSIWCKILVFLKQSSIACMLRCILFQTFRAVVCVKLIRRWGCQGATAWRATLSDPQRSPCKGHCHLKPLTHNWGGPSC